MDKNYKVISEAYDAKQNKKKRDWENLTLGGLGVAGAGLNLAVNELNRRDNLIDIEALKQTLKNNELQKETLLSKYPQFADYNYRPSLDTNRDEYRSYLKYKDAESNYFPNESDAKEHNKNANINSAIVGGIIAANTAAGIGSLMFRSKRQQIVFQKVMERFPTAKDMCAYLEQQNLHPKYLSPNTPDQQYAIWVRREIVKKGRFWNFIIHFLYGFNPFGLGFNAYKYAKSKVIPAEEMVYDAMKHKPKYKSLICK